MKRNLLPCSALVALIGLVGCGGSSNHPDSASTSGSSSNSGSGSSSSPTLSYVNPVNASGTLALVLDADATPTNLILDLVGGSSYPATGPATGVAFAFDVDTTKAVWAASPALTNGTLFTNLGSGVQLAQGWVAGGRIQGLVSYKGSVNMVADMTTGIIAKITLTPAANATAGAVSLVDSGFGAISQQTPPAIPMTIAVGTLTCN